MKEGHNPNEDSSTDSDQRQKAQEQKKPEKEEQEEPEMKENRVSAKGRGGQEKATQEKQGGGEGIEAMESYKEAVVAGKNQAVQLGSD